MRILFKAYGGLGFGKGGEVEGGKDSTIVSIIYN